MSTKIIHFPLPSPFPQWLWLAYFIPVQSLAGGTFILVVYSFLADNSRPRDRMIVLAVLGMVWDLSYTISLPLGAWLFNSWGYVRQGRDTGSSLLPKEELRTSSQNECSRGKFKVFQLTVGGRD